VNKHAVKIQHASMLFVFTIS